MSSRFWKNLHPLIRRGRKNDYEDDTNYAILNAIDIGLKELEEETFKSRIHSSLKTAKGQYLEEYGDFFGVYRKRTQENDEDYRGRIIEAVNIPRGTNKSIKMAVRNYLENNTLGIEVYEPWKDIFYLNKVESTLSGKHKLQGSYYHFAVIDVFVGTPFGRDIVDIIDEYKPAGVTLHLTYDPSLEPHNPEMDGDKTTITYTDLHPKVFEETLEMYNNLYQPLRGSVFLSDTKMLNKIFNLNLSRMSSLDVLSGGYGVSGGSIHIAGLSSDLAPKKDTQMRDILKNLDLMEFDFYRGRDKKDNNTYGVQLRPTKHFYVNINLDEFVRAQHPELDRFQGEYAKLFEGSTAQITYEADVGSPVDLQVYDYVADKWVTLKRKITSKGSNIINVVLSDSVKHINENQILIYRVKVHRDMKLYINSFRIDYVSNVREVEVGVEMGAFKSHPILVEDNLIKNSDKNPVFKAMLVKGTEAAKWVPRMEEIPEDIPFPF